MKQANVCRLKSATSQQMFWVSYLWKSL